MTLVRFNNRPAQRSFNNLMDDLFPTIPSLFRDDFNTGTVKYQVPVNVKETENGYELEVVAPGFNKEDFRINLEAGNLTIEVEKKTEGEQKTGKEIRKEYSFRSFKRSFTLDEHIDAAQITARYVNGVLALNLPRKAEVKESVKQIAIQ